MAADCIVFHPAQLKFPDKAEDQFIGQQVAGEWDEEVYKQPGEPGYEDKSDQEFWFNEPGRRLPHSRLVRPPVFLNHPPAPQRKGGVRALPATTCCPRRRSRPASP